MERKARLRRFTELVNRTPMKRSPMRPKHRRTRAPRSVEEMVIARDEGRCLLCGHYVIHLERGVYWSLGHRLPRGMGGTHNPAVSSTANEYVICGSGTIGCHGRTEGPERVNAYAQGWLLKHPADPTAEPITTYFGRVFLTTTGTFATAVAS